MKAMILKDFAPIEQNPLELVELAVPEPGPSDILIRVNVCGVCHTDLHTVEGELPEAKLPIIPGHQVVGRVAKRGENASRFSEGDRVGVAWLYSTDSTCLYCQRGNENLCSSARFTGYHVNGGYAEYIVIPEKFAYVILRRLSTTNPFFIFNTKRCTSWFRFWFRFCFRHLLQHLRCSCPLTLLHVV